ncbi:MAG TPA: efflux transporter outer membrane subunit [Gemmatimonadales bacterium]|nr:efflux transporter outer membrane subunit [Gemmatimonadales bacterium]
MRLAKSFVILALTGCAVGPNYQRPETPTPAGYRGADSSQIADSARSIADVPWWTLFKDTTLTNLIHQGLAGNFDLRIATARVDQAAAFIGVAKSQYWPQIDAGVGASRTHFSTDQLGATAVDRNRTTVGANLGLSWEIDLFGRVRRMSESATAQFLATEEARRGVLVDLVASIGQAYLSLRELDLELEIAHRTLDTRRGTLTLFQQRFAGGVASNLEVQQAAADVAQTEATIPDLERRIVAQENLINFLLGRGPGTVPRGTTLETQALPPEVPVGLPSTLLERRPDVLVAENNLVSANAEVGVAKADFFPRISLTGLFGVATGELKNLGSTDALLWSVGGGLLQPIFHGGAIRKNYQASLAARDAAIAEYLRSTQNAFREVANALADVHQLRLVRISADSQVIALREAARLARIRYEGGLSNYLEVLDADRRLFGAENELAQTIQVQVGSYIDLYRALGGGWNADQPAQADSTKK